jgi:hypothetical protein
MQAVLAPQMWTVPQAHCAALASALAPGVLARCAAGAGKLPVDQPPSSAPDIPSQLGEQGEGLHEACQFDSIPHASLHSALCLLVWRTMLSSASRLSLVCLLRVEATAAEVRAGPASGEPVC